MATKERKKKVTWTAAENELVVREAVRILLNDKQGILPLVKAAQSVLPEDRRRVIAGRQQISSAMEARFEEVRREILDEGVPFPVSIESIPTPEVRLLTREEVLRTLTTEELFTQLAPRLASIVDALPAFLQGRHRHSASATPSTGETKVSVPAVAPVTRKAKVLLCEFLPGQIEQIREKAKDFNLELVFQPKTARPRSGTPPSCQWCVCMDKRGHPRSDILRKRHGLKYDRILLVGGVEAAVKALADINSEVGRVPVQ